MTAHLPNTSEIRNIYASGADEFYYDEEEGYTSPTPETYPERTAAFDLWLRSTLAYAESLGYARGKAEANAVVKAAEGEPLFTVHVDPRELVSVPPGVLGRFGDPIPDYALAAVGFKVPTADPDETSETLSKIDPVDGDSITAVDPSEVVSIPKTDENTWETSLNTWGTIPNEGQKGDS